MSKRKLFWYTVGKFPNRVVLRQRRPSGPIYAGAYDRVLRHGRGDYRWLSLGHHDEERAKTYAADQHAKLVRGETMRPGHATLNRLLALYLEHRTPRKGQHEQEQDRRKAELWLRVLGSDKDPHAITLRDWEGFLDARGSGAIDSRGHAVPAKDRHSVRARTVEVDANWLRWVLNWGTKWRDDADRYVLTENAVRGYEVPTEQNPRRPVATQDRYAALRAVSDRVTMELRCSGRVLRGRSYLSELLDLANGTGRRISAICQLRYDDLRLNEQTYGVIRWPADTDKIGRETVVPIGPTVRAAIDRILGERPGIGRAYLFPAPGDGEQPISRHLADGWLRRAERLAGLESQEGSLWHAFRRKWATERKDHSDVDVAAAGGWNGLVALKRAYQQADPETMLRVVLEAGELREAQK
jgi:integrase